MASSMGLHENQRYYIEGHSLRTCSNRPRELCRATCRPAAGSARVCRSYATHWRAQTAVPRALDGMQNRMKAEAP